MFEKLEKFLQDKFRNSPDNMDFDEMPQFMYGLRNIQPRSIQMQFRISPGVI